MVALNEHIIITNATAARALESVDQALLWEHASRAIRQHREEPQRVVLSDGAVVSVACREVSDAAETIGAVLRIRPAAERPAHRGKPVPVPALGSLAGKGSRWRELCRSVQNTGGEWALITGEPGSGKLAVAEAMAGDAPVRVFDAAEVSMASPEQWLRKLEDYLGCSSSPAVMVIRHIEELDPSSSAAVARLLRNHRRGPVRVLATTRQRIQHGASSPLPAEFAAIVEVPALRDRPEDLAALLNALTAATLNRLGSENRQIRWLTDAVQTLTRLDWPGNVASLEALVREVVGANRTGYISANDLPPDVVARASRRKLTGLEQVEATAIIDALRDAGGNKNRAADALGIARSTLYRKLRALGIDLSTMAF